MVTKSLSLVEQKKLQWAREREELAGLGALWGPPNINSDGYRPCIRTRYVSALDVTQTDLYLDHPYVERSGSLHRSPSLPPVHQGGLDDEQQVLSRRRQYRRSEYNEELHSNEEGETSGYASDSNEWQQRNAKWGKSQRPERSLKRGSSKQHVWPAADQGFTSPDSLVSSPPRRRSDLRGGEIDEGVDSPPYHRVIRGTSPPYSRQWSSGDEASRLKWGDRGVGVGHLWEPAYHEPECRLPQVDGSERATPVWLERSLNKLDSTTTGSQVLVINHPPSAEGSRGMSRRLAGSLDTISIHSAEERSFIRGQNAPVDPEVLLERETKRQKALELQNAIRLQLEERDRKRKADIERRIKEEREEDDRIRKERERERQRVDEEQRKKKEKEEKEAQKTKAMQEALENADKVAREERSRANRKHVLQNLPDCPLKEIQCNACLTSTPPDGNCFHNTSVTSEEDFSPAHTTNTHTETSHAIKEVVKIKDSVEIEQEQGQGKKVSSKTSGSVIVNRSLVKSEMIDGRKEGVIIEAEPIMSPEGIPIMVGNDILQGHQIFQGQDILKGHPMLQGQDMQGGVQLALLMSPGLLMEQTGRLLTPSKYRRAGRECSTQTDVDIVAAAREARRKAQRKVRMKERDKSASLERPHRDCKLPIRCRSQSQPRVNLEDRPKWGVNRPGTQYRKQSEKDPYYQRRMRKRQGGRAVADTGTDTDTWPSHVTQQQHHGNNANSDDYMRQQRHSHSDDYSRSPSPPQRAYNRRNRPLYRRQQQQQQPQKHTNSNNEVDKEDKGVDSPPLSAIESFDDEDYSPARRNKNKHGGLRDRDKYVNVPNQQRLETEVQSSSKNVRDRRTRANGETSKYIVKGKGKRLLNRQEQLPITIDTTDKNVEEWSGQDILSQLTSLRNGLLLKQQQWENPKSPTSFSESSWYSNS